RLPQIDGAAILLKGDIRSRLNFLLALTVLSAATLHSHLLNLDAFALKKPPRVRPGAKIIITTKISFVFITALSGGVGLIYFSFLECCL
ncbi:MAG: hypothetical protein AAF378_10210, partial [Cyanobacteria bacterium P01_A01_bin.84]